MAGSGAMRDRILDATESLLTRLGYRKMTMDDVAQEAGIGKRTIYVHFPSKEEVALASIDRVVDRLTTRLSELAQGGGLAQSGLVGNLEGSQVVTDAAAIPKNFKEAPELAELVKQGKWDKTPPGPTLPEDVIRGTLARYHEAYRLLTGSAPAW